MTEDEKALLALAINLACNSLYDKAGAAKARGDTLFAMNFTEAAQVEWQQGEMFLNKAADMNTLVYAIECYTAAPD